MELLVSLDLEIRRVSIMLIGAQRMLFKVFRWHIRIAEATWMWREKSCGDLNLLLVVQPGAGMSRKEAADGELLMMLAFTNESRNSSRACMQL